MSHVDVNLLVNARSPDVRSIALGGGSRLQGTELSAESVGYRLSKCARVFGGDITTLTDLACAAGRCEIGNVSEAKSKIDVDLAERTMTKAQQKMAQLIDEMKLAAGDVQVLLVGGGAALFGSALTLDGVSEVIIPSLASVANALGAALAQVSAVVERTVTLQIDGDNNIDDARKVAVEKARKDAIDACVARGAAADSVRVAECIYTLLSYSSEPGLVLYVKAIGVFQTHFDAANKHGGQSRFLPTSDDVLTKLTVHLNASSKAFETKFPDIQAKVGGGGPKRSTCEEGGCSEKVCACVYTRTV